VVGAVGITDGVAGITAASATGLRMVALVTVGAAMAVAVMGVEGIATVRAII
jgi:hypothetical protein